jgi:cytochrome P450
MSYTLYELACNPKILEKAQEEVDQVLGNSNSEITEEVLGKLEYLEQCIMETVRVHCPVFNLSKISLTETEFPPQYEDSTKSLIIDKDTNVVIPVYALHFDKDYFPNPYSFNPDRWSKENRESIPKYAFLGFGEGPRICLGMKFGISQVKAGIASILFKYNVKTYEKTEIPLQFSKQTFNLQPANGIWLKLEKRSK